MKNPRLSGAGKALLFIFGGVSLGGGTGYTLHHALQPDRVEQSSPAAPGGIDTLVNEFSAAVTAEAKAKMEAAAANAGKPEIVRQACADVGALMARLSADSGISTKITVTPYEAPGNYFEYGYCAIEAGGETITFINDGDELTSESDRRYMIDELISKLPGEDILKIHAALSKAPRP